MRRNVFQSGEQPVQLPAPLTALRGLGEVFIGYGLWLRLNGAFLKAKGVFSTISHVQEAVLILSLFIQRPHCCAETQDKRVNTHLSTVVILCSALSPAVSKVVHNRKLSETNYGSIYNFKLLNHPEKRHINAGRNSKMYLYYWANI